MDKIMAWGLEGDVADWSTDTLTISTSPVPGPSLPYETVGVRQLAAGFLHNLVLLEDKERTVWAWGDNYFGQLGNNTHSPAASLSKWPV
jgi:alpha-tubulin suppressor-like RCC1 family protein